MNFQSKRSDAYLDHTTNFDTKRSQSDFNLEDHVRSEKHHANISENSKVYWDLSNTDEIVGDTNNVAPPYFIDDRTELTVEIIQETNDLSDDPLDLNLEISKEIPRLKKYVESVMQKKKSDTKLKSLDGILKMVLSAWTRKNIGRDLAENLCDVLRDEMVVDKLIINLKSSTDDSEKDISAQILSQIMTVNNRNYVAKMPDGISSIIDATNRFKTNVKLLIPMIGVLQCLFKHSKSTCKSLITNGGLDSVLYACRYFDTRLQRHCALALANLALYGGDNERKEMINRKTPSWLFPLAFSSDDYVKYYGFLAIVILSSYPHFHASVVKSGALQFIEPFLRSHDPKVFAIGDAEQMQGQSTEWLRRLVPLLDLNSNETNALVTFHLATEAGVGKTAKIFEEVGAIDRLCKIVRYGPHLAARFAKTTLIIIGVEVPHRISSVYLWSVEDVSLWLQQIGESQEVIGKFRELKVDGDILLLLSKDDMASDLHLKTHIHRMRLFRHINQLKESANYESFDETKLFSWLIRVNKTLNRYTYPMLKAGITTKNLHLLNNDILLNDCFVFNGLHRAMILEAILDSKKSNLSSSSSSQVDVFISYRRINGSQLASLLKVHLHLRRFTVFLDIERLQGGEFDTSLITSIKNSRNFILVLTPNALDRCIGDDDKKDWIHKEIVAALESDCNIIPILDNFEFPKEDLPADMEKIKQYNAITWIHEYQDACVNKLEQFLHKETLPIQSVNGKLNSNLISYTIPKNMNTLEKSRASGESLAIIDQESGSDISPFYSSE